MVLQRIETARVQWERQITIAKFFTVTYDSLPLAHGRSGMCFFACNGLGVV